MDNALVHVRAEWVQRVLGKRMPATGAATPDGGAAGALAGLSLARLGKARLEWRESLANARAQMNALKRAIVEDCVGEDERAIPEALRAVDASMKTLDDRLTDELDAILNADAADRAPLIAKARASAAAFATFLLEDTMMSLLDGNDVLPQTMVCRPLRRKLAEIQVVLPDDVAEDA